MVGGVRGHRCRRRGHTGIEKVRLQESKMVKVGQGESREEPKGGGPQGAQFAHRMKGCSVVRCGAVQCSKVWSSSSSMLWSCTVQQGVEFIPRA